MVHYRRNRVPGGTYFFTVTLRDRGSTLLTDHIGALREAYRHVQREHPFRTDAIVVLPDHLHAIWTLPAGDADYPGRWKAIKGRFTRVVIRSGVKLAKNAKGEYPLWQRRYWEHTIQDGTDLRRHIDYIHDNPVKHGHVASAAEWPYSSFHRFFEAGVYPDDWGAGEALVPGNVGWE